jgi:peptidoglycan/xylan/chitin deacetylase (PgdA/CDA1 family)
MRKVLRVWRSYFFAFFLVIASFWWPAGIGAQPFVKIEVPILMYHQIGYGSISRYCVSSENFYSQMDFLRQNCYQTVGLADVAAALSRERNLPPRPIVITFDDGWSHLYTNALSALKVRGFKAAFFIIAGHSGCYPAYLSWEQIRAMRDDGMEIGAHSFTHPRLTLLSDSALHHEISDAKLVIEKNTKGGPIDIFAYPYGVYTSTVLWAVKQAGYKIAVAVEPENIVHYSDQLYRLGRLTMTKDLKLEDFKNFLVGKKAAK